MSPSVLAIGETIDGRPTRLTLEVATLATRLAAGSGPVARVLLVGSDAAAAAPEVAAHGPDVLIVPSADASMPFAAAAAGPAIKALGSSEPLLVLLGASPDGKDLAGTLVGLTDLPVLASAAGVSGSADTPEVTVSAWGGRLITTSRFTLDRGIILVRPGSVSAAPAATAGRISQFPPSDARPVPDVRVVERVREDAARVSIDDARAIVGGGRGLAGPEGFGLLEELAHELGGAVGATRAAVDSGWIDFGQQIGQTGKSVKPDLYVACGISGAIQHRVGIQSAGTIIAINRDPDAPIAEFADMLVVGDLHEIVPRLTEAIRQARAERP